MKLRILSGMVAVAIPACMTNCATVKTTRVLEDGTKVESSSYGLTDRAASFAGTALNTYIAVKVPKVSPHK